MPQFSRWTNPTTMDSASWFHDWWSRDHWFHPGPAGAGAAAAAAGCNASAATQRNTILITCNNRWCVYYQFRLLIPVPVTHLRYSREKHGNSLSAPPSPSQPVPARPCPSPPVPARPRNKLAVQGRTATDSTHTHTHTLTLPAAPMRSSRANTPRSTESAETIKHLPHDLTE